MPSETPMKTEMCEKCLAGATGEEGHADLKFYVSGPYPGHNIYKCEACNERWIRHLGTTERYGWTRYAQQFSGGIRQPAVG